MIYLFQLGQFKFSFFVHFDKNVNEQSKSFEI